MNGIQIKTSVDISVTLNDILDCVDGDAFNWSILYLLATGDIGKSIPDFEEEIRKSVNILVIPWADVLTLSKQFNHVIDIILIGERNIY